MAQLMKEYPMASYSDNKSWDAVSKSQESVMKVLRDASDKATADKPVGFILQFPVADGYAFYRVMKAKPLTLQFIPYGDCYCVPNAHIRGLRWPDIVQAIENRDWWSRKTKKSSK